MNIDKDQIYAQLASQFVPYTSLIGVDVTDNHEPMRDVSDFGLKTDLSYSQLPPSTSDRLILRCGVCERLVMAQNILEHMKPGYRLILAYAYRSMKIQRDKFEQMKRELGFGERKDEEAYEQTHHFIAVPELAGHPTGGAVDLLIENEKGSPLDFGTKMHELQKDSYMFSPFISEEARQNRELLRDVMIKAGFAPYDGEWWHYSYGDREWAAFYKKSYAMYAQLEYDSVWLRNCT